MRDRWLRLSRRALRAGVRAGTPGGRLQRPDRPHGPAGNRPTPASSRWSRATSQKDAPLVVGCRTSGRSQQAAMLLEQAGFINVLIQNAGFVGASPMEPGWGPKGLPTSQRPEAGRSWDELAAKGRRAPPRGDRHRRHGSARPRRRAGAARRRARAWPCPTGAPTSGARSRPTPARSGPLRTRGRPRRRGGGAGRSSTQAAASLGRPRRRRARRRRLGGRHPLRRGAGRRVGPDAARQPRHGGSRLPGGAPPPPRSRAAASSPSGSSAAESGRRGMAAYAVSKVARARARAGARAREPRTAASASTRCCRGRSTPPRTARRCRAPTARRWTSPEAIARRDASSCSRRESAPMTGALVPVDAPA